MRQWASVCSDGAPLPCGVALFDVVMDVTAIVIVVIVIIVRILVIATIVIGVLSVTCVTAVIGASVCECC